MEIVKVLFIFSFLSFAQCETFRFSSSYGDHMVLQRDPSHAIVWGFGENREKVALYILGRTYKSQVVKDSRGLDVWKIVLDPIAASGPCEIVASSKEKGKKVNISLKDVYFGDIWLCGGQSNMAFTVSMSFKAAEEIDLADNYPRVRLFTVKRYNSQVPVPELSKKNILQRWSVASKTALKGYGWNYFSAVCWMYGRRLYDLYGIPIGLISNCYGGTAVEAWSSPQTLQKCGIKNDQSLIDSNDKNMHSGLWNAMLYPFLNMTIYGVIWYQGETNAYQPATVSTYNCTFPAMIRGWREEWFEGTGGYSEYYFPFGFVQISSIDRDFNIPGFPVIRWKQTAEYGYVPNPKQKNTFMTVSMDLLDSKSPFSSIHPRDKTTVAERLLLGAQAIAYKEDVYWTGPIVSRVEGIVISKNNILVVHYKSSSLKFEGIDVRSKHGFEMMLKNSTEWEAVGITSSTRASVSLHLDKPLESVFAIRYAWNQKPCLYKKCAIYAKDEDLPSPPFVKYGPFVVALYWSKMMYYTYSTFQDAIDRI